jgi:hypothetical protein
MAKKKKRAKRASRAYRSAKKMKAKKALQSEVHPTRRRLYLLFYNLLFFAFLSLISFLITIAINQRSAWALIFSYFGLLMAVVAMGLFLAWIIYLILYWTRKSK